MLAVFSVAEGAAVRCRGVRFNQLLTECFSFHSFDNMSALNSGCKKDPRLSQSSQRETEIRNLRFAIQHGDVEAVEFRCSLCAVRDETRT